MEYMDYLFQLYKGTPRQGPGTKAATKKALGMIKLPPSGKILDIGCGAGSQTMTLLENTDAAITAFDFFKEFLEELTAKAVKKGLEKRLVTIQGDMNAMSFMDAHFDCIWSEGAIYIMGFETGICAWKKHLKTGGFLVVSDAAYIRENPPAELVEYWKKAYPGMNFAGKNIEIAKRNGYEAAGSFVLEKQGWKDYYSGLDDRLAEFKKKYKDDTAKNVAKETEEEMQLFDKYGDYYSYVFYVMRKK
jgi:cyclopropane fatty-acyl-phospholipid synthase-like methyltransferase